MGLLKGRRKSYALTMGEVHLATDDNTYSQNDTVTGSVIIRTEDMEFCGDGILVQLIEYWEGKCWTDTGWTTTTIIRTIDSEDLSGPFRFLPHTVNELKYDLRLPLNCRITDDMGGWMISVDLVIPGIDDPGDSLVLDVLPSEEIAAVIETLESGMRFREIVRSRRWDPETKRMFFKFDLPSVLKCDFDFIALEIEQTGEGGIRGEILFDLQENSIMDYFKVIVGKDRKKRYLELSSDQIHDQKGLINQKGIINEIMKKMQYILMDECSNYDGRP